LGLALSTGASSEPKSVVCVFDEAFPPFTFEQDGTARGFELDVLARILKSEGLVLEPSPMHWDAAQEALRSGKADVTSGMGKTAAREKMFNFARTPTYDLRIVIWAPDSSPIKGPDDLEGRVVATERGSLYQQLLEKRGGMTLKLFETESEALDAMVKGEAEAWAGSNPTAHHFAKQRGYQGFGPKGAPLQVTPIYYVFSSEKVALRDQVSDALEAFKSTPAFAKLKELWSVD